MTERRREGYVLTTDPGRVDIDLVHSWLSEQSYWAKGRDRAVVERSVAGSHNYSVFKTPCSSRVRRRAAGGFRARRD